MTVPSVPMKNHDKENLFLDDISYSSSSPVHLKSDDDENDSTPCIRKPKRKNPMPPPLTPTKETNLRKKKKEEFNSPATINVVSGLPRTNNVELMKLIATGGQAAIFLARLPLDRNSLIIVKVFYKVPSNYEIEGMRAVSLSSYATRLIGEARIYKSVLSTFSRDLSSHGIDMDVFNFENDTVIGWCYERLQGDLETVLLDPKQNICNAMKMLIALQIAYFIRGVHNAGFIFRDLKPSNVLLNISVHNVGSDIVTSYFLEHFPVIKVTDFGLVTRVNTSKKTKAAGTVGYMPIVQMSTENYGPSVDVHAYAITVAEIFINSLLYDSKYLDSEVEEEMRTLKVIERVKREFARQQKYIPSMIRNLVCDALSGKNSSIESFIEYFENALKMVSFAHDSSKCSMVLLRAGVGTPARHNKHW